MIILTGGSGSGKTKVIKHLLKVFGDKLSFVVSATTRTPREDEIHGKDYFFLSHEEFETAKSNSEFFEFKEVYPNMWYGILYSELARIASENKIPIVDVDTETALSLKNNENIVLGMRTDPEHLAENHIMKRSGSTPEEIQARIDNLHKSLPLLPNCNHVIINDFTDSCSLEAESIVRKILE